jgi:hypothetical protein
MAILGSSGRLILRREPPAPVVLAAGAMHSSSRGIHVQNQDFWNGDLVYLVSTVGLPMGNCPDGYGFYAGSSWDLSPARAHVEDNSSLFYGVGDEGLMYDNRPPTTAGHYYIYRDQLDRVSFYTDPVSALNGSCSDRLPLDRVNWGSLIMAPAGTDEYEGAVFNCAGDIGEYRFSDARDEVTLESICEFAPYYLEPTAGVEEYGNADVQPRGWVAGRPWRIQCDLREWTLDLSAANVEVTALGEKWGESVKSLVTGGGSLDFLLERHRDENGQDGTALLQLLMLTEKGCKAEAQFWMINGQSDKRCDGLLPGDLYYGCSILVTQTAVNCRPTELIAGTAQFVTTGEIALKMGERNCRA